MDHKPKWISCRRGRRPEQDPDRLSHSLADIARALSNPKSSKAGCVSWRLPPIFHRLVSQPVFYDPVDPGGDYLIGDATCTASGYVGEFDAIYQAKRELAKSVLVQHCLAYFLGRKCLGSAPIALCHPSLAESLLPLSVAGVRNIPQQAVS